MTNLRLNLLNKEASQINTICNNYFEFEISTTEIKLVSDSCSHETYTGNNLDESALNTSWADYYFMLMLLEENSLKMLDIGSSYSKGTLLSEALGLENIHSVELIEPRVNHSKEILKKMSLNGERIFNNDALEILYKDYDILFIYQPVSKFLSDLLTKASLENKAKIWAIESHGDLINRIDLDSRFINKIELFKLASKRHLPYLYQYNLGSTEKNELVKVEETFYRSSVVLLESNITNFGKINWISKLNNSFIDYIENVQTISINNKRINIINSQERVLEFNPTLSQKDKNDIEKVNFVYNGKKQKILKHIVLPDNYIELQIDGIVKVVK